MILIALLAAISLTSTWVIFGHHRRFDPWRMGALASIALLVVLSTFLWTNKDDIDRYRITLNGYRFSLIEPDGSVRSDPITLGGPREAVDVFIPGAGHDVIATLRPEGEDTVEELVLNAPKGASGLIRVARDAEFLGSQSLLPTGEVVVTSFGSEIRLIPRVRGPRASWHTLQLLQDGQFLGEVDLPPPGLRRLARLREWLKPGSSRSPSVRTYPLADILAAGLGDEGLGLGGLRSFLYYSERDLRIALLDEEVGIEGLKDSAPIRDFRFSSGINTYVVRLPLRDYLEPTLTAPERRGVRALRNLRIERRGESADVLFSSNQESYALTKSELDALSPHGPRSSTYQLRISPTRGGGERRALPFVLPADRFAAHSAAILRLPRDPRTSSLIVITPAGEATEELGTIIPLGEATEASLLVRVDRMALTALFWVQLFILTVLTASAFYGMRGRLPPLTERYIAAGAVLLVALLTLRALVSLSAALKPPFFEDAWPLALWLIPAAPWLFTRATLAGHQIKDWLNGVPPRPLPGLLVAGPVLAITIMTRLLFESTTTSLALIIPVAIVLLTPHILALYSIDRVRYHLNATPWLNRVLTGLFLPRTWWNSLFWAVVVGGGLLVLRAILGLSGIREAFFIGGVRVSVSILYTPVLILASAVVAREVIRDTQGGLSGWFALGAFVVLGLLSIVLVGVAVSDLGLLLTILPGLLLLALISTLVMERSGLIPPRVRTAAPYKVIPLGMIFFLALQANPWPAAAVYGVPSDVEVISGAWSRDELLILDRLSPDALQSIGQTRSEAVAIQRATMEAYTRSGLTGAGFLQGTVSPEIRVTAVHEHTASVYVAGEWGASGTLFLLFIFFLYFVGILHIALREEHTWRPSAHSVSVCLIGVLAFIVWMRYTPGPVGWLVLVIFSGIYILGIGQTGQTAWFTQRQSGRSLRPPGPSAAPLTRLDPGAWIAVSAVSYFVANNIFMLVANHGLTLFTGKNIYFFGLDSISDAMEALFFLVLIGAGIGAISSPDSDIAEA